MVGVASLALTGVDARSTTGRRAAFVVAACLVATASLLGVEALLDADPRLLLVPAALSGAGLVPCLRRPAW